MQTPNSYRDYFAAMVAGSGVNPNFGAGFELNGFYYAESQRAIEQMRSDITYPVMWLGVPAYTLIDNGDGNYSASAVGELAVVGSCERDDYEGVDDMLDKTYSICRRILAQMYSDSRELNSGWFFSINNIKLEPIMGWFTDHDYGWLITIKIPSMGFYDICPQ